MPGWSARPHEPFNAASIQTLRMLFLSWNFGPSV
jgi:hypothetical protein